MNFLLPECGEEGRFANAAVMVVARKVTVSIICSLICLLEIHWFILENLARLLYHAVAQMGADLSSGKSRKMQFSAVCLSTTSTSPF